MTSPIVPTHGKLAALHRYRPNGFIGSGLNDVSWGAGFSGGFYSIYTVEIDAEGTPDTFTWSQIGGVPDGGVGVAITGAEQTLTHGQTITFAATTGHTIGDGWIIVNFYQEACTESGNEAQITDANKRLLNPNSPPIFTDSGGKNVLTVDYTQGKAVFDGAVSTVTVTGNNGRVSDSYLTKAAYLYEWNLDMSLDMSEIARFGQNWKEYIPGQASAIGGAAGYFIGSNSFFDNFENNEYLFMQLFNYDPDADQTGDHFCVWATINGINVNAPVGEVVKEAVTFEVFGIPSFTANS